MRVKVSIPARPEVVWLESMGGGVGVAVVVAQGRSRAKSKEFLIPQP